MRVEAGDMALRILAGVAKREAYKLMQAVHIVERAGVNAIAAIDVASSLEGFAQAHGEKRD